MPAAIKHLDKTGGIQITSKVWPDAFAGVGQTPEKFAVENSGDRTLLNVEARIEAVGTNDGSTMLRFGADTATVIPPYGVTVTLSGPGAGGVWPSTGTRFYRITAINATGETTGSLEVSVNVDDVTKKVTLSWTTVPGATGYKIYRSQTAGVYTSPALRTTIGSGTISSFNDDGAAVTTGALPTDNTTGGWALTATLSGAGAGGVWPSTGTRFWRVVALDTNGVILAVTLEASVNVDVTTKTVALSWLAVPVATSYKVYRSTTTGSYPDPALVATVTVASYTDTGTATTAGVPGAGPSYGIPPALATSPLAIANLAVGQEFFYWVNRVVPGATPETGNPRVAVRRFLELP